MMFSVVNYKWLTYTVDLNGKYQKVVYHIEEIHEKIRIIFNGWTRR